MTLARWVTIAGLLLPALAAAQAPAQGGSDLFLVIDSSGSMVGRCGSTCQSCKADRDCPDGHHCGGGRCRLSPDLMAQACKNRWPDVLPLAQSYLKSLPDGTSVRIFTFDHAGANPVVLPAPQTIGTESRQEIVSKLQTIQPASQCTHLFDIANAILDQVERLPTAPNRDRLLWILTDGDDDGSVSTGAKLRERLQSVQKGLAWQIVAPRGALKSVCDGNTHCRPLEDKPSTEWRVTASLELASSKMSLQADKVEGKLRLNVEQETLFPFAIGVQFLPESADSKKLLKFQGSRTLRPDNLETPVSFILDPDLAAKRPEVIRGTLVLTRQQGAVTFSGPTELPFEFHLDRVDFKGPPESARRYDMPDGSQVEFPLAREVFGLLTHVNGYEQVKWNVQTAVTRDAQIPKPSAAVHRADLSKDARLSFTLSGRCLEEERRQGAVLVSVSDTNGWFSLGTLMVPIDLGTCGSSGSASWILLVLLVLLGLALLLYLVLRSPALSGIRLLERTILGVRDRGPILQNAPMRWGRPSRTLLLQDLGNAEELGQEAGSGLGQTKVQIVLGKDNRLMARASIPVFERFPREDPQKAVMVGELSLGRIYGQRLVETPVFRVLSKGPYLRLAGAGTKVDESLFGENGE